MTELHPHIALANRIATARSALNSAALSRGLEPAIADEAVTELLTDLRHFCRARRIDFYLCDADAHRHFEIDLAGGQP